MSPPGVEALTTFSPHGELFGCMYVCVGERAHAHMRERDTGRAGKEGVSHTFFTSFDKGRAGELVNVLREAKQEVPEELMKFGTHVKKKEHTLFGAHFKDVDMSKTATKKKFDDSDDDE